MESVLFITSGYPTEHVQRYTFLDNLVCAMKDMDVECTVVYPVSMTHALLRKEKLPPKEWVRTTRRKKAIKIYSPRMITLSTPGNMWLRRFITRFNNAQFRRAVDSTIRKKHLKFTVAYGHFISPSGVTAARIGKKHGCPSCLAYGENTSYTVDELGMERTKRLLSDIGAVVAVSS